MKNLHLACRAVAVLACFSGTAAASAEPARNIGQGAKRFGSGVPGVPARPDQRIELGLKINQSFTVVGLGDMLQFQPFAKSNDPDIQYLLNIIREADMAVADFENEIMDFDNFGHYGHNLATKEVADDWALMGIDMVSRANNKPQDAPGIWENFRQVERVGIVHVGVARTMREARMARYFSTPKGLAGFIGVYAEGGIDSAVSRTSNHPSPEVVYVTEVQLAQVRAMKETLLARRGEVDVPVKMPPSEPSGTVTVFGVIFRLGPKPDGVVPVVAVPAPADKPKEQPKDRMLQDGIANTLRLTLYRGVTAEQMAQLRAIAGDTGTGRDLSAFGTQFRIMDRPGEHSFDMNAQDRREILTQIRTGKQASDILVSNTHWHQNRFDFQAYSHDHFPADFEIKFAREAIDNGVDVFVAQGVHTLKGVEIYKGKPIFYGTSNFVFQTTIMPKSLHGPEKAEEGFAPDAIIGEHEIQGRNPINPSRFWQLKATLKALLTHTRFENGKLAEVRIYPVDLGLTPRPGSQVGIPKRPSPEIARQILEEVIEYSKPFGTKIEIEDGVGVIRMP
ncbi:MAG TPA: CapA family protein [Lacunisphaera sp.]